MRWSETAWQSAQHIISSIERCRFVRKLSYGTLSSDCFRAYIAQDIIYMRNFEARLRLLHHQMHGTPAADILAANIDDTLAAENSLHSLLADRFDIEPETRKCPANMAYDRMLTRLEKEECAAYTFASLLPCYWVYAHIGLLIFRQHTAADNPYVDWIATYGDPSFQTDAEQFRTLCDSCAAIQTDSTLHRMTSYFLHSTALELRFWRDCYRTQDR
ncbi:MAG: hypothetical protein IAC51_04975 [bacterium]|uniref:Thiaminase-2/PQQC domain-containing protein n=1 Tax=Candidatus Aphodosoma intestinipullorum TaxID=2840674 RepID=A0A940DL77_9BACT|nr:hypothetical protein [Candidatus Aphodosoma intestinipullorum]